jgi:hypothetical protein
MIIALIKADTLTTLEVNGRNNFDCSSPCPFAIASPSTEGRGNLKVFFTDQKTTIDLKRLLTLVIT